MACGDAGQEIAGAGVAIGEGPAELASENQMLGQFAEFAEGHLVLDVVAEEGPGPSARCSDRTLWQWFQ